MQNDTKTIRAITAGVPPDAFFLWNPNYLGPLAANGAIECLDGRFRKSGLKEQDFVPASLGMCRCRGRLYAMPLLLDDNALFWNKDAFREVGLDPERPPRTLEELANYAVRLTKRDARGRILRLGLQPPQPQIVCSAFGGRFIDESTGRITANCQGNIDGFRWLERLYNRLGGHIEVNTFTAGFGQGQGPQHPFFVGKVAMMVSGEWIPSWVERYAPKLDYGIAPFPYPRNRPQLAGTTWLGGNPICIPTGAEHPDEAWMFIKWLQTPEVQEAFAEAINNVPNIRSVLASPKLTTGSRAKVNFGKMLAIAGSTNARYLPPHPAASAYQYELTAAFDAVMFGRKTPERALADLQSRIEDEAREYEK